MQPQQTIQLLITLDPRTNQVQVTGPIDNKFLCYGMMETAKDAIRDRIADQADGHNPGGGLVVVKGVEL